MVQNKAEALLVLFLRFVYHFCLLKTDETFKRSLGLCFLPCQFREKHEWPEVAVTTPIANSARNIQNTSMHQIMKVHFVNARS